MSHPRRRIPGGTYLVTHTTVMSLFLLVPGKVVNQIMEYCMAWAARERGILLHAISIESNHYHMVVTDVEGRLSDFIQEFQRTSARCLMAYYRAKFPFARLEGLWSAAGPYTDTLLVNAAAVLDKLIYTFTNPVKDGLVRDYRQWPGFNTRPSHWRQGPRTVERPDFYFKNTPETLTYELTAPSQLGTDVEQVIADVEGHIRREQAQIATNMRAQGRSFAGAKAVLRTAPLESPSTPQPKGKLAPRLAAGGDAKALATAAAALKLFRIAYREAWKQFKELGSAVFPGGTLLMHKRFGVECEPLDVACWCELAT
ncbi:MAG: transposase [Myxococcales bacterium]|jgi:REP element-mobilizing transposase RayT